MRLVIAGGAGFVGSTVAVTLAARHPDWEVTALDNLARRGSELNLARLAEAGVRFRHVDVREPADVLSVHEVDAVVECSAEPSVLAGRDGETAYALHTNTLGAYHCLELARREQAQLVFLSTSRVYPLAALRDLRLVEAETRFELAAEQPFRGASTRGVAEAFPLDGARTLYGTTKLAAELLVAEYREMFGLSAVVDRCGVIAGPWQLGKVDQGIFTWWALAHWYGLPLRYLGFGGTGKQVRDLLHVDDLVDLVEDQLLRPDHWDGFVGNVGGGRDCSYSLLELTEACAGLSGRRVEVARDGEDRPGDVPVYLSDCTSLFGRTDWRPARDRHRIMLDIFDWIGEHEGAVERALVGSAA